LGIYKNVYTKIKILHNICGYNWDVTPNGILRGARCPKCAGLIRLTIDIFKERVYKLTGSEYEVLGKYKNMNAKILMRHNVCGHEWMAIPSNFLGGTRCSKCFGKFKKTTDEFKREIYNLEKDEYEILGEYKNALKNILFKHNKCEHEFNMRPNSFLNGQRCPKCSKRFRYNTETFKDAIKELVKDEYSVLGKYVNNKIHILMKHNICNTEYNVNPNAFLRGCRCPKCFESKGEQRVRYYLEDNNIKCEPQYTFNDLLSDKGNCLKFDFGILENNELKSLVEYDGAGHYREDIFGKESYELTVYHDHLKNIYCQQNNIPLIRIPYWEFDIIENILDEYFKPS
jgi:hypothetical protein